MFPPLEELLVLALLLFGVVGVYYALKLHYIFAFGLVKKTAISEEKKQKIEKIKSYIFAFLKVLLFFALLAMFVFGTKVLMDGLSLKAIALHLWQEIPEGFWLSLLWTLLRIAVLIVVARYILKRIFAFLERAQERSIAKKRYNTQNVRRVYGRIHDTIKYTFVLGIVYRIVHFFPFLVEVSHIFLIALILFFIVALGMTLKEVMLMRASQRFKTRK